MTSWTTEIAEYRLARPTREPRSTRIVVASVEKELKRLSEGPYIDIDIKMPQRVRAPKREARILTTADEMEAIREKEFGPKVDTTKADKETERQADRAEKNQDQDDPARYEPVPVPVPGAPILEQKAAIVAKMRSHGFGHLADAVGAVPIITAGVYKQLRNAGKLAVALPFIVEPDADGEKKHISIAWIPEESHWSGPTIGGKVNIVSNIDGERATAASYKTAVARLSKAVLGSPPARKLPA